MEGEVTVRISTFFTHFAIIIFVYFVMLVLGSLLQKEFIIPVIFTSDGMSIQFFGFVLCLLLSNLIYFFVFVPLSNLSKGERSHDSDSQ